LLTKSGHKTRTCPYCGLKVAIPAAKKVAVIEDATRASELLRRLKEKAAKSNAKGRALSLEDKLKKGH